MKRAILLAVGLLAVLVALILFLPRLRDTRLTLHALVIRFGLTAGLDSAEIEFQSSGSTLSGTIVFPQESRPRAAIVLIHGSGRTTRMLWVAHFFTSTGFAVLTYDKRGVGKSGGTFVGGISARSDTNLHLLAHDAAAAAAAMSQQPRLRGTPVGYVGFSQGGWIGPLAAAGPPAVSFMVFFSGPLTTVAEDDYFNDLAGNDADFWRTHTHQEVGQYMKAVRHPSDDLDPRAALSQLRIPAFWAFGGLDHVMPVDLSITRLQELIAAGQSRFHYTLYPEYGHELIVYDFFRMSLSRPLKDATDWIKRTVGGADQPRAGAVGAANY